MKIKQEHFDLLKKAIEKVQSDHPLVSVITYIEQGLTPKRFRWDLLLAASRKGYIKIGNGAGCDGVPLYAYLDDTHIDTALRRITGTK